MLAGGAEGTERPELMRDRVEVEGETAYVYEGFAYRAPVTEPAALADALEVDPG